MKFETKIVRLENAYLRSMYPCVIVILDNGKKKKILLHAIKTESDFRNPINLQLLMGQTLAMDTDGRYLIRFRSI